MSLDWLLAPQLRAFAEAGYEVVGMSAPGPHVEHLEAMGIRHVAVPAFTRSSNPLQDVRAFGQLVRLLRRERPDVLHTHNPKPGILGRVAGRLTRVPRIVNTQHGLYAQPSDRWQRRLPVYAAERVAAAFGHVELVQNPEDVATLTDTLRVPRRKVRLLGNGIDLDHFDPDRLDRDDPDARDRLRAEWGIDGEAGAAGGDVDGGDVGSGEIAGGEVVVGMVGRLVVEKGIVELLEAFEQLHRAGSRARLVVVGPTDPGKADALPDDLITRATDHGVVFTGQRTDMPECYRAFDVFVTASWREGFPRSAMEAAAMGLPTVASDIRGNRQVIDHDVTGVLVPVRNADAIAAAVSALVDDADRRSAMSAAARRRAADHFDQRTVIARSLAAYRGEPDPA